MTITIEKSDRTATQRERAACDKLRRVANLSYIAIAQHMDVPYNWVYDRISGKGIRRIPTMLSEVRQIREAIQELSR